MHLDQDRDWWRALLNTVVKLRTQLHGVIWWDNEGRICWQSRTKPCFKRAPDPCSFPEVAIGTQREMKSNAVIVQFVFKCPVKTTGSDCEINHLWREMGKATYGRGELSCLVNRIYIYIYIYIWALFSVFLEMDKMMNSFWTKQYQELCYAVF